MEHWPRIDIHIITMNGVHHLRRLLPSLIKTAYPYYRVFLLDNSSSDEAAIYAKSVIPSMMHLDFDRNLGFAKANNEGLKRSMQDGTEFVVLLNDDTEILDPEWLTRAVQAFQSDERIAAVGFKEVHSIERREVASDVRDVEWIKGFCMAIRTGVLETSGLFDEKYFAYYEETDMLAAMKRIGVRIVSLDCPVFHAGKGSFGNAPALYTYLMTRNGIRYAIKHEDLSKAITRPLKFLLECVSPVPVLRSASSTHNRKTMYRHKYIPRNLLILVTALAWNIINLPSALKGRIQWSNYAA